MASIPVQSLSPISVAGLDASRQDLFGLANEFMRVAPDSKVGFECSSLRAKLGEVIDELDCMEMASMRFSDLSEDQQIKFDNLENAMRFIDDELKKTPGLSQLPHHVRKVSLNHGLPEKIRSFTCSMG